MQYYYIFVVQFMIPLPYFCLQVQNEYEDSGLLYSYQLQFEEGQLGEGAFGVVRKAKRKMSAGESVTVAIKSLKGR